MPPTPSVPWDELKASLEGELSLSSSDKNSHSSDASIFSIEPAAVCFPKNKSDVGKILRFCSKHGIPVHGWGAGTSRGGQPVGNGLIVDFRRHMNKILGYDGKSGALRAEPGAYYSEVQKFLAKEGRSFPPDPSYHQCTIGGMVANNAAGIHSVKYGGTVKHVLALEYALPDGSIRKTSERNDRTEALRKLLSENASLIRAEFPKVEKNSSGYNLDLCLDSDTAPMLCRLFSGSEGTLALFTEITVSSSPLPEAHALGVAYFKNLEEALKAAMILRSYSPAACELVDKVLLDLHSEHERAGQGPKHAKKIRRNPYLDRFYDLGAEAILITEMDGESREEAEERLENAFRNIIASCLDAGSVPERGESLAWDLRRHSSPILNKLEDGRITIKPLWAVEDVCLPKENFLAYIREQKKLFEDLGLSCSFFGHAASCNLHIDPVGTDPRLALKDESIARLYEEAADKSYALVIKYGGTISGEHGDGLLRTKYLKMQYPKSYPLFAAIKKIFDPAGILNPGKIVEA